MFLVPFQWCLACILGHLLELICLSEITKQIHESENLSGRWAAGRDLLGQGFIRQMTPSFSQQQIHYNNGLQSHQQVRRSPMCGHGAIRTRLLYTMCEARQKSSTFG